MKVRDNINRHVKDSRYPMTIEFNVKNLLCGEDIEISDEDYAHEWETGYIANYLGKKCFNEIMKSGYKWVHDWGYSGRMNGWYILECDEHPVQDRTLNRLERIVDKYKKQYVLLIKLNYDKRYCEK